MKRGKAGWAIALVACVALAANCVLASEPAVHLALDEEGVVLVGDRRVDDDSLIRVLRKEKARTGASLVIFEHDISIEALFRLGPLINETGMRMYFIDADGERRELKWTTGS